MPQEIFVVNNAGGFTLTKTWPEKLPDLFPFVWKPKGPTRAQRSVAHGRCGACHKKPWDCRCKKQD